MFRLLFKMIFAIIQLLINIILLPINAIVSVMFPSFTDMINTFNSILTSKIGAGIAYFASILPPITKSMILLYLGILVTFYTVSFTVHGTVKILQIIQKIKFW